MGSLVIKLLTGDLVVFVDCIDRDLLERDALSRGLGGDVEGKIDGELVGVLDLDSPIPGRFDEEDVKGCAELAQRLAGRLGGL